MEQIIIFYFIFLHPKDDESGGRKINKRTGVLIPMNVGDFVCRLSISNAFAIVSFFSSITRKTAGRVMNEI